MLRWLHEHGARLDVAVDLTQPIHWACSQAIEPSGEPHSKLKQRQIWMCVTFLAEITKFDFHRDPAPLPSLLILAGQ